MSFVKDQVKIFGKKCWTGGCQDGFEKHVLKFSHVPRPIVLGQLLDRVLGNCRYRTTSLCTHKWQEMVHQQWDVVRSSTKGGQENRHGTQAPPKVFTEPPIGCRSIQRDIARAHEPYVGTQGPVSPQGGNRVLLDRAKQLGLNIGRQLAHFIKKKHTSVRLQKAAFTIDPRVREGTGQVSEERAFEERSRYCCAVDVDEREISPRRQLVYRQSDELFASTGFPLDEHRHVK